MREYLVVLLAAPMLLILTSSPAAAQIQRSAAADGTIESPSGGEVLYSQLDEPSGEAFTDQAFEASYAAYDATGADDFMIPGTGACFDTIGWTIERLDTPGSQSVLGSVPSFVNVAFYADAGGVPGAPLPSCEFPANVDFTASASGDLSIYADCWAETWVPTVVWVSQQVRQDFNPFGQHFWATRNTANNSPAVWKNPGGGFGTACTDWAAANAVCGQVGEDMLFELRGVDEILFCDGCPPFCDGVPAVGIVGILVTILAVGAGSVYVLRRR